MALSLSFDGKLGRGSKNASADCANLQMAYDNMVIAKESLVYQEGDLETVIIISMLGFISVAL